MGIIAYEISPEDEKNLLEHFPAKYPTIRANHITVSGGNRQSALPPSAIAEIIGYADDGNGVETLVVTINGEAFRELDGKRYHITLSYNPEKLAPPEFGLPQKPYGGVHSNALIEQQGFTEISFPYKLNVAARYYEGPQILPGNRLSEPGLK